MILQGRSYLNEFKKGFKRFLDIEKIIDTKLHPMLDEIKKDYPHLKIKAVFMQEEDLEYKIIPYRWYYEISKGDEMFYMFICPDTDVILYGYEYEEDEIYIEDVEEIKNLLKHYGFIN